MPYYRICVVLGAIPLVVFFLWPWIERVFVDPALEQQVSIHAGGINAQFPMMLGLFGTLGLVAMLIAVKR
jgi:quinol-cytochrome oxidoreductase complex cytochrome b subunit